MNRLGIMLLLIGCLAAAALSVAAGKVWVPLDAWTAADPRSIIIVELRLPRTVLALTIGAALGAAGRARVAAEFSDEVNLDRLLAAFDGRDARA